MATFISHSPEETTALGEDWGRAAKPGWVIGLTGDLGAGKTQLIKGFARGLGITGRIQSPTFALVNEYRDGRLPLAHIDLYRLDSPEQIVGAGLEDYFHPATGTTVVEWCEHWPDFAAPSAATGTGRLFRRVLIEQIGDMERRITYDDFGG
jgi:tRNA threonylcarbamoyladenosine biosynthesis protein TsaE